MPPGFQQFDRPDLNSRLNSRRRLPGRTNASAIPSTMQNGVGQPIPPIITYSEFLGTLDNAGPMNANQASLPSVLMEGFVPFQVGFDIPAGPSRPRTGAFPEFQPSEVVESAWIKDVFGKDIYVGHGKIEEVGDDGEEVISQNEDAISTPRPKPPGFRQSLLSDADSQLNDDIPFNSTPPPCPKPKKLPSLRETSTASMVQSVESASKAPGVMGPLSTIYDNGPGPSIGLDEETEVSLVKENLKLVTACIEDIKFMNTYFLAQGTDDDLSQHIDICTHIQESLKSLHDILRHRARMGSEEWNVRSLSWHQKYSKRIVSLRTTLQRLERVRQSIEAHSLRPHQRQAILTKLEQHEAKLKDLASKFTVSFDRIQLRHLHFLISQSHDESKRQKAERTRILSRTSSFEKQWQAGKTFRAGLRRAYNQMRQAHNNAHSFGPNTATR